MTQRGFLTASLVLSLAAGALVIAALGVVGYKAQHWCNTACESATARAEKAEARTGVLEQEKATAQQRATDMALLAAQRLIETDTQLRHQKEIADAQFATLQRDADALRGRLVRASRDLDRLLNDAVVAANASNPTTAEVDHRSAATVPDASQAGSLVVYDESELGAWVVGAGVAYRSCRMKLSACIVAYDDVRRAATPKEP